MQMRLESSIIVNQDIERLWKIMALEFTSISKWASAISFSIADDSISKTMGAPVGGRVCKAPGYGDVYEEITHFDSVKKEFSYRANSSAMPTFVTGMENNWVFHDLGENRTEVSTRAFITMNDFPGRLLAPFMRLQMSRMGKRFREELKYYAETGEVAASKKRALAKVQKVSLTS